MGKEREGKTILYNESNSRTVLKTDSVVDSVIDQLIDRASVGKKKYGTTMDRNDLSLHDWCEQAIQEALDMTLYLKKIQNELIKFKK
jgi:hypothetical protein